MPIKEINAIVLLFKTELWDSIKGTAFCYKVYLSNYRLSIQKD